MPQILQNNSNNRNYKAEAAVKDPVLYFKFQLSTVIYIRSKTNLIYCPGPLTQSAQQKTELITIIMLLWKKKIYYRSVAVHHQS